MEAEACIRALEALNAQSNSIEARLCATISGTPLDLLVDETLHPQHQSSAQADGVEELGESLRRLRAVAQRADRAPHAAARAAEDDELREALRQLQAIAFHADEAGG